MPFDITPDTDFLKLGSQGLSSAQSDYDRAFQTGMQGSGGALDYLRGNPYPKGQQSALRLAAGFLAPTKSGGWAESFGNAAGNLADQNDVSYKQEMDRNLKIADIQRLQAGLYQTKGNTTLNQMNNAMQLPSLASAATEAGLNYSVMRDPNLMKSFSFGAPPTSNAPVTPGETPPPAPAPGTSNVPMPAPSPRASLRVPQPDMVAGDAAIDYGRAVPVGPKVYPPGSPNPLPRSVLRPGWPETPKGPDLTPGQYPSAPGLPRTPGAPNYNWQPKDGDPRTPGTAIPGGSIPDSRVGSAAPVDDQGRPVNPAMLAASGTASDASNAPEVTAAQAAAGTPPTSPAGPSTPPSGAGASPAAGAPGAGGAAPGAAPQFYGTREASGYSWAPSQWEVDQANRIRQQLQANPRLGNVRALQPAIQQAQDVLERSYKADTQRRADFVAAHNAKIQDNQQFYTYGPGHDQLQHREAEVKRTESDIDSSISDARLARDNMQKADALEAAYRIAESQGIVAPGKFKGWLATKWGDPAYQFLEAESVRLRNVKAAGPGAISNYEQQIIAATTAGPTDSPEAFHNKLTVIRTENMADQLYAKFVRQYADVHGSTKGVDDAWGEYRKENPLLIEDKKRGLVQMDQEAVNKWQAYVYPKVDGKTAYERVPDGGLYRGPDGKVRKKGGGE